jgi:hypothetical protein
MIRPYQIQTYSENTKLVVFVQSPPPPLRYRMQSAKKKPFGTFGPLPMRT